MDYENHYDSSDSEEEPFTMDYENHYDSSDSEEEPFSMGPTYFYTSTPVTPNEDRCNLQVSKIVVDPAPYVEPVTPKGNSSNEDRCNSQRSSISEDLDTYLDNEDDIELKSATDISSDESEHSEYVPSKEDLLSSDEDSPKPQENKKKL